MSIIDRLLPIIATIKIEHLLKLSPYEFDQTKKGWRSLPHHKAAIKAINTYINKYHTKGKIWHHTTLKDIKHRDINPGIIHWHLGQLHAMQGNYPQAIKHMRKSLTTDDPQWNHYTHATIAFLNKDKNKFELHSRHKNYNTKTLNRLRKRWGQSYYQAY